MSILIFLIGWTIVSVFVALALGFFASIAKEKPPELSEEGMKEISNDSDEIPPTNSNEPPLSA